MILQPVFDADEAQSAYELWGMNCGPSALAVVCGVPPNRVRPWLDGFDAKRYTNPRMMFLALTAASKAGAVRRHHVHVMGVNARVKDVWPRFGLARIQWEGPWLMPGVPIAARYRQTHWVAAQIIEHLDREDEVRIFDVNAMRETGGILTLAQWSEQLVPWLTKHYVPRADGGWHITHSIEVERVA